MHYLSSSEADCLNHEPQINCSQVVDFNTDGSANLVLTDIAHLGKYELKANKIHLSTSNDLGNSDRIIFSIISDQEIKRDDDNTIWVLKK